MTVLRSDLASGSYPQTDALPALEAFVRQQNASAEFKFIVSLYGGKDFGHPIAVVAWRWLLYLDSPNLDAIRGFAQAHYGNAPEPLGGPAPPGG